MGMPVARGRDEGSARLPVDAGGVEDGSVGAQLSAHQAVAAGIAVDDQIEGHRLVAVGRLGDTVGHHPEHGPEGVGDGAGGGQVGMGQQDAEPVGAGGAGVRQQLLQGLLLAGGRVVDGREAGDGGQHPQVVEQGGVMHPVQNALLAGLEQGVGSGGEHEQIPLAPAQAEGRTEGIAGTLQLAGAAEHIEQRAGGGGGRLEAFA